ncbi:MAG: phytanoyl-CoA dioxygenase family protein [Rhodobacter sp.]|nr:phytanoyl-CoA dioxygenase family protein [Rhodobacter sp.]
MDTAHQSHLAQTFARDGYAFPIDVMTAADAAAFHTRIEALESGPIGRGPEAQRLYRFKPHLIFAWAAELVRHPKVLDAVAEIIGPDIMVWAAGLFIKEPHDPTPIKWHQDGYHMDLSDNSRALRAWVALTETTAANGTMHVIEGSHHAGFVPHAEDDYARHLALRGEHIEDPDGAGTAVPVTLQPGQMSLHHVRTIHGSPGNTTGTRRMTLAITYLPPGIRPRSGRDTATLVRGRDRHGHWLPEPAHPSEDYDLACTEAHRASMQIRLAAYHGAAMPHP